MKILFVADGRSPIALNWIRYFIKTRHEVHLVSSFTCEPEQGLASFAVVPVAMSEVKAANTASPTARREQLMRRLLPVGVRTSARQWLGPLTIPRAARRLSKVIDSIKPELIHSMRIPYEGMLSTLALQGRTIPHLVSIWGNDFTLHAPSTPLMRHYTRRVLAETTALHTDCARDLRMANEWGFASEKPAIVLPGAGGIQLEMFYPSIEEEQPPLVLNPRGLRAYVRTDTVFMAIKIVHAQRPDIRFACTGMEDQGEALRWVKELGLEGAIELLAPLSRSEMADLFRKAQVMLSITTHDGTPNTLLEGLASGCFPIAGDLESIREWITPGVNGLLVNPTDPSALASAILQVLDHPDLRATARDYNLGMIRQRAEYGMVMRQAEEFCRSLL